MPSIHFVFTDILTSESLYLGKNYLFQNIKDHINGQQRVFTLSLFAVKLLKTEVGSRLDGKKISQLSIAKFNINNAISILNLKQNLQVVKSRVKEFNRSD